MQWAISIEQKGKDATLFSLSYGLGPPLLLSVALF
jgi:hypothetical protein